MGYRAREKRVLVPGGRVSAAEAEGRARLKAEIAELSKPAFGVPLTPREKEAIASRVRSGLINQSGFPRVPGGYARGKN